LSIEVGDKIGIHYSLFWLAWHYRLAGQTTRALHYCQEMPANLAWVPGAEVDLLFLIGMV
jgi:hypothetical protein